jgi:uncharacterized protein (DUF433 family)
MPTPLPAEDARVADPLYTMAEAALFLGQNAETFRTWVRGGKGSPSIISANVGHRGDPIIPFIGLAEGAAAAVMRRVPGISTKYIKRAVAAIREETGLFHAFASRTLFLHGAKILAERVQEDGTTRLIEVVSKNAVFKPVVEAGLKQVFSYDESGWADSIILPTGRPVARVRPQVASGQPLTIRGGARVIDIIERFRAESFGEIAADYAMPVEDVEEIIRAFYSREAA